MRKVHLLIATLMLCVLSGCGGEPRVDSAQIHDSDVTSVTLSADEISLEVPTSKRVIALANGAAEIVAALGLKNILVGRDIASTDAQLLSVPIVTSGHQVIPEKIIAAHPDVVLIDASTGPQSAIDQIVASGISVKKIPESWTLVDISPKVLAIGDALGVSSGATALNTRIQAEIQRASVHMKKAPRMVFLYLRGTSSIYLMGGPGSGADSLLDAIGARDVGAEVMPHPFNTLTAEALAQINPEIILVMTKGLESVGGVTGLVALPGVGQTDAGKNSRIIAVDDSLLLSFGPRTPSMLALLSKEIMKVAA
ncbi:unannotated protein [freshwater metagenome]|uniref:Unannotated protein n=1 Tax=freshwater metagenome TaxID=449393 RepID=A0A6J7XS06_9ZZZZ|nr:ABC transporter substrate-binding protein [Actinomycetota bacterium]